MTDAYAEAFDAIPDIVSDALGRVDERIRTSNARIVQSITERVEQELARALQLELARD